MGTLLHALDNFIFRFFYHTLIPKNSANRFHPTGQTRMHRIPDLAAVPTFRPRKVL